MESCAMRHLDWIRFFASCGLIGFYSFYLELLPKLFSFEKLDPFYVAAPSTACAWRSRACSRSTPSTRPWSPRTIDWDVSWPHSRVHRSSPTSKTEHQLLFFVAFASDLQVQSLKCSTKKLNAELPLCRLRCELPVAQIMFKVKKCRPLK